VVVYCLRVIAVAGGNDAATPKQLALPAFPWSSTRSHACRGHLLVPNSAPLPLQPGRGAPRPFNMTTTDISLANLLDGANYARLTTFRRNGQAVPTTIWFALEDDKAYFVTGPTTGKAKRMRGTPRVLLGPSTPRGKPTGVETECRARQLDNMEAGTARDLLFRKYGIQFRILQLIQFLSRSRPVYFELTAAA